MSNFGTMRQEILETAGKSADASTATSDAIKRAIYDAVLAHRSYRLWFTESTFAVTLVASQSAYAHGAGASNLPVNLMAIIGDRLDIDLLGVATNRYELSWVSMEFMRDLRRSDGYTSQPELYTYYGQQLELYPTPNAADVVRGNCLIDPGLLVKKYSSPNWAFYVADGTTLITDAYTSDWFDPAKGYNLIRNYAEYLLWSGIWQGAAGQQDRAIQRYTEWQANLKEMSSNRAAPRNVQPWGGDY